MEFSRAVEKNSAHGREGSQAIVMLAGWGPGAPDALLLVTDLQTSVQSDMFVKPVKQKVEPQSLLKSSALPYF